MGGVIFFQGVIYLGRVVVPSPLEIVINLPRIYEKLPCKGEPNWFSGQRDPLEQTYSQTSWYCIIRIIYPTEQRHDTTDI